MITDIIMEYAKITIAISILIIILLILTPVLHKRYSARWRCVIWIILAGQLIIPVTFSLPDASIKIYLGESKQNDAESSNLSLGSELYSKKYMMEAYKQINTRISSEWQQNLINPSILAHIDINLKPSKLNFLYYQPIHSIEDNIIPKHDTVGEGFISMSIVKAASIIWITGSIIYFILSCIAYVIYKRKLNHFPKESVSEQMYELLIKLKNELGFKKLPDMKISAYTETPVLAGFFKPVILLPHEMYSNKEAELILRHELIHYKRRDLWYKLILTAARCIHWFNPLVHIMTMKAAYDIELACDEKVVNHKDHDYRGLYGDIILKTLPRTRKDIHLAVYFGSEKKNTKSRLKHLFDYKARKNGILPLIIFIFFIGILCSSFAFTTMTPNIEQLGIERQGIGKQEKDSGQDFIYDLDYSKASHVKTDNTVYNDISEDAGIKPLSDTAQYTADDSGTIIEDKNDHDIEETTHSDDILTDNRVEFMKNLAELYAVYGLEYNISEDALYYYENAVYYFSFAYPEKDSANCIIYDTNDSYVIGYIYDTTASYVIGYTNKLDGSIAIETLFDDNMNIIGIQQTEISLF